MRCFKQIQVAKTLMELIGPGISVANIRKHWTHSACEVTELGETLKPHGQNRERLWPGRELRDVGRISCSRALGPNISVLLAKEQLSASKSIGLKGLRKMVLKDARLSRSSHKITFQ